MNFTELKDELYARGTDYLEEDAAGVARAERWLNQAYREILNLQAWPFLETYIVSADGVGFIQVLDLRKIRFVTDVTAAPTGIPGTPLSRASMDDLVRSGVDLSLPGTPEQYYTTQPRVVAAYPLGGTIRVDYIKRVPLLSGTDNPAFDDEYHDIIVDKAMVKAYKDSDNFEAIPALKAEVNERLSAMAEDYMLDSREVRFLVPTGSDV